MTAGKFGHGGTSRWATLPPSYYIFINNAAHRIFNHTFDKVGINQYDKVVKRRRECRLYKLTGGQTDRQADRQAAPAIKRLRLSKSTNSNNSKHSIALFLFVLFK